jgi:hypothetical protein
MPESNQATLPGWPNDYGEGVGVADAWAAFSLCFATFAVACCSRSASFCKFGFAVGVGLTVAASSEREQAPRIKQQERDIPVRKSFMMNSGRFAALFSLLSCRCGIGNPEKHWTNCETDR